MKVLNLSNINLRLGLVLLVLLTVQRIALAGDESVGEQVVDQFLGTLKTEVLVDLSAKVDKALSILECLEDEYCSSAEILFEKYSEYRIYLGLAEYKDLSRRIKQSGNGYAAHNGAKVFFSNKSENGREELEKLYNLTVLDKQEQRRMLAGVGDGASSKDLYKFERSVQGGARHFYSSIVSEYLQNFPFFGFLTKQNPSREDMAEAIVKVGEEIEKSMASIEKLEGESRLELMGFSSAVETTVSRFSKQDNEIFTNYLNAKNNDTRFLGRLFKILTNVKMMAIVTCHVATYAMAGIHNPIIQISRLSLGLVCASIGVTAVAKYFGGATIDILRQFQYTKTMQYSSEIWFQNLRSYMITSVMAYLYVIPSLSGIANRLSGIRSQAQLASRAMRMNKLGLSSKKLLRFDSKRFKSDVKGLSSHYAVYYGEELAIHSIFATGGKYVRTILKVESALVNGVLRSMDQAPRIFNYGRILNVM